MTIDAPRAGDIPGLRQLWKQAFGDTDGFLDGFFATGFSRWRCRCLHTDGQLAAALYWFDCTWQNKTIAYVYAVATVEAFRGKGLCRALMEDTHKHLQRLGYAGAVLVPGNKGLFSLYEKMGYRAFCPMETVTAEPGNTPAPIQPITPAGYAAARPAFLPAESVLHGGAALDFYATYGQFYQTQGAVFCAAREANTLYFQEYLGDPALLPGILAALRAERGILPLPGGDSPFAMYLPLDSTPQMPAYFGIPLN